MLNSRIPGNGSGPPEGKGLPMVDVLQAPGAGGRQAGGLCRMSA